MVPMAAITADGGAEPCSGPVWLDRDRRSQRRFEAAFLPRGDAGLLKIKLALDTAARFVSNFPFLQQPIDVLALGIN
jgi:hypothetical protein